ncbi:MAG: hypothetical protein AAF513_10730 [Pseudomonadota bacterium]
MSGFIEGENRYQTTLFPERVDDYVDEDSAARVIDVFVDRLDISGLGFKTEAADIDLGRELIDVLFYLHETIMPQSECRSEHIGRAVLGIF